MPAAKHPTPREQIVKGIEYEDGQYGVLTELLQRSLRKRHAA
ncbi:hypothetical protein ACSFA8_08970 [Variovorax sp. RT4R15]